MRELLCCCRANQFRVANTDSSVFFLQNGAAAEVWPVTEENLGAVRHAFKPQKQGQAPQGPRASGGATAGADALIAGDFAGATASRSAGSAWHRPGARSCSQLYSQGLLVPGARSQPCI